MKDALKENFGMYFLTGEFEEIYQNFSPSFQNQVPFEQFREHADEFNRGVSHYTCFVTNRFLGMQQYAWVDNSRSKAIHITFDGEGVVHGLNLKPFVAYPDSDQIWTKNRYSMPVNEEWQVFWGGTNEFVNYHYLYEQQRYAYDLVKVVNNRTNKNTTIQNENYFAFGAEVVAPADGIVVQVIDGIKDNVPGEMNEEHPTGNYCIIAHDHNEFSMLAHFKMNSIRVKVGDKVKNGQLLGLCGNSGNSSEAHIHFQVMNQADFLKAKSLRIKFHNDEEPIQGDFVTPSAADKKESNKFDKIENSLTVGELLLTIPRIIGQLFFK